MKTSNKGYTLAELLISLAIFSIIMVCIITIMRNTLFSYTKSSVDVFVQEDAQIVANQIEELLCDAKDIGISNPGTGGDGSYTFKSNNISYNMLFDPTSHEIKLKYASAADYDTLANNVNSFTLDGWNTGDDNQTIINIDFNMNGTSYKVKKDVYFRNMVENSDASNIQYVMVNTSDPDPDSGYVDTLHVLRFEDINMTSRYGIRYGGTLTGGSGKIVLSDSSDTMTTANDDSVYIISTSDTINSSFSSTTWNETTKTPTEVIVFSGYEKNPNDTSIDQTSNKKMEILLVIDAVKFTKVDPNSTMTGVYQTAYARTSNSGYHTYVDVKGININNALKPASDASNTIKLKYTIDLVDSSGNKFVGADTAGHPTTADTINGTVSYNSGSSVGKGDKQMSHLNNGSITLELFSDPNSNGLIISSGNPPVNGTNAGFLDGETGYNLQIKLEFYKGQEIPANRFYNDTLLYYFRTYGTKIQ